MFKRYIFLIISGAILLPLAMPGTSSAQWSVGVSYEVRDEDPTNGFGARIERDFLGSMPLVEVGLRAHFSYFSETNSISNGITIDQDFESFDAGLAATGGVSVGLVTPYVGLGIGWDNTSLENSQNITDTELGISEPFDESDFYWNAFAGARVSIIPFLKPFIEYRFSQISGREDIGIDNVSRLAIGISLRF